MALYYNLANLNAQKKNDSLKVEESISAFVFLAETKLLKLEKAISKKKYEKVLKHISKLFKYMVLFEIDECIEYSEGISFWADNQGSKKAISEVYKAYKIRLEKALKEMKRDFKISSPE